MQFERRLRFCDLEVATANSSRELTVGSSLLKGKPTVTKAVAIATPLYNDEFTYYLIYWE